MEEIYKRFAPQKVSKVGGLLLRYRGDEDKLLRLVRRKYVGGGGETPRAGPGSQGAPDTRRCGWNSREAARASGACLGGARVCLNRASGVHGGGKSRETVPAKSEWWTW